MTKKKRSTQSYEERLRNINPNNRFYVEQFLNTKHGNERSYKNQVFRFAEYFKDVSIDQISSTEIENYLLQPENTSTHIVGIARILTFFLKQIPSQETNVAQLMKIAREKQKEIKNKEPISLDDIITFRNNLIANKYQNKNTLFVFEMLYVYGIKWEDFKNINKDDYSISTGELRIKSIGTIKLNDNLRNLIGEYPEVLNSKSYAVRAGYLHDASTIFEHSITETVIEATRNKYFPTCQRCNHQYPNTSEYWALVECKNDTYHKKWLLCVSCANEVGGR